MDRYELDRAAHVHGYEQRESEPHCEKCIHQPMCSGENCHFDRKWEPEELEKKYYIMNDADERVSDELYSLRDLCESDLSDDLTSESEENWRHSHPFRDYKVRLTIEVNVRARDSIDAKKFACQELGVFNADTTEIDHHTKGRLADVDVLHQYRMPVEYLCCETGREYGHKYIYAKSAREAKFLFQSEWVEDIESNPCFDDIEGYDACDNEWYSEYVD